jgi:O-antigen/teichoic acid export membrane protein
VSAGRRTASAILAAGLRHFAGAAAGLIVIPLVGRMLGAEALGAWALLGTGSFLIGIADLGMSTSVQRAAVRPDHQATRRAVGLSLLAISIVAPLAALGSFFVLIDIPGVSATLRASLAGAGITVLVAGAIGAIAVPYRGFTLARGGVGALARARSAASAAQVLITWVGLVHYPSVLAPAAGLLAAALIETGLTVRAARALDPELPLLPVAPRDAAELRAALHDGSASMAINLGALLALRFDVVILSRVCPLAVVAAYGVGSRAVDQSFTIAKQVSAALLPRLGDPKARESAVRLGTALLGGLVASGMAALSVGGQGLRVAWAGPVAAQPETAFTLALLATAAVIAAGHEVASAALMLGSRTPWSSAGPIITGYAINVAISLAFAQRFGVWAVAGGTVIGNALTSVLLWGRARKLLAWSMGAVAGALAPAAAAGSVSAAAAWALTHFGPAGVVASLATCIATTALGCGAAALVARRAS